MKVLVERQQYHVQLLQLVERYRWIHHAPRPHPLNRKRAFTEYRIRDDVQAIHLKQDRRVTNPRRGVYARADPRLDDVGNRPRKRSARWRGIAFLSPSVARPPQHVAPIVRCAVGPGASERAVCSVLKPARTHL